MDAPGPDLIESPTRGSLCFELCLGLDSQCCSSVRHLPLFVLPGPLRCHCSVPRGQDLACALTLTTNPRAQAPVAFSAAQKPTTCPKSQLYRPITGTFSVGLSASHRCVKAPESPGMQLDRVTCCYLRRTARLGAKRVEGRRVKNQQRLLECVPLIADMRDKLDRVSHSGFLPACCVQVNTKYWSQAAGQCIPNGLRSLVSGLGETFRADLLFCAARRSLQQRAAICSTFGVGRCLGIKHPVRGTWYRLSASLAVYLCKPAHSEMPRSFARRSRRYADLGTSYAKLKRTALAPPSAQVQAMMLSEHGGRIGWSEPRSPDPLSKWVPTLASTLDALARRQAARAALLPSQSECPSLWLRCPTLGAT